MSSSSGRQSENNENNENKINALLEKVKTLENEIKEKDKKINDLNKKIEELQKSNKPQVPQVNNFSANDRILELEEEVRKLRDYFLSPGEELITLKIVSNDQTIKFETYCKPTDKFSKIEEMIGNRYPNSTEVTDTFFLVNGIKVNRLKTIQQNSLKNNDVLTYVNNEDNEDD